MSGRGGPPLFWPSEVSQMTKCAECGGDISGGSVVVRGRVVHRDTCEGIARTEVEESSRAVPDPPCFVYPDE